MVKPFIDNSVVIIYLPFDQFVVLLLELVNFGKQIFLGLHVVGELVATTTERKEAEQAGEAEVALQTAILDVIAVGVPHLQDHRLRKVEIGAESELKILETKSRDPGLGNHFLQRGNGLKVDPAIRHIQPLQTAAGQVGQVALRRGRGGFL